MRLYVNDSQVDVLGGKHQKLLPQYHDGSFEGYNRRMGDHYGFEHYALIVADWHQFDRSIWERIVASLAGLTEHTGISASRIDTQVFLGTYKTTPFGVHVDAASAFHFPLMGAKVMRFWRSSFAAENPMLHHAHDYESFLHDSLVIQANPGEAIYWPSHYWHVGEGDGAFSVTWRFAYWIADGIRKFAVAKAAEIFEDLEQPPLSTLPRIPNHAVAELDLVENLIRGLTRAANSNLFRQCLVQSWLERYSAYGFLRVPAEVTNPSSITRGWVCKKPVFRILTTQLTPGSVCVAAAGRSCILPYTLNIDAIVDKLNKGDVINVEEIFTDTMDAVICNLINFCFKSGVLFLLPNEST